MVTADIVLKVTAASPTICSNLRQAGMIPAGDRTIRWLNIQRAIGANQRPPSRQFLVVLQDRQEQLWGLLVDTLPNSIELAPDKLQSLPKNSDRLGIKRLASHVWFLENRCIYLLENSRLFKAGLSLSVMA